VFLRDIWPTNREVARVIESVLTPEMYRRRYADVFRGDDLWQGVEVAAGQTYAWDEGSTYVRRPTLFADQEPAGFADIIGARPLAILGDSVTTDHISPAGSIKKDSPAGAYLIDHGVNVAEFNSYGSRRGNHEVMMRGTFANIRIRNEMVPGTEGGLTRYVADGTVLPIYDAAIRYQALGVPLVVIAGKEYGTGSSRDWAAKGARLLGVRAVIAESYERIHRSNLVGMGVLPLEFDKGVSRQSLALDGSETFDVTGLDGAVRPRMRLPVTIHRADGSSEVTSVLCRIDTVDEIDYFRNGGILQYVLANLAAA
jgi:aconitate hydratase